MLDVLRQFSVKVGNILSTEITHLDKNKKRQNIDIEQSGGIVYIVCVCVCDCPYFNVRVRARVWWYLHSYIK